MAQNDKKKSKLYWVLWAGFVLLVLVVGLGPLAMLISFTRADNTGESSFWERFQGAGYERLVEQPPDENQIEPYHVQYLYRYCSLDHGKVFQPKNIPAEYPVPPRVLTEIAVAMHNSNLSIENFMDELKDPQNWYLTNISEGSENPYFMLTYLDDFCPDCAELYYLGVFNDKIAVYQGEPPHGKLVEVTEFVVQELHRKELEDGVPFVDEEDKIRSLEGYTS